MGRGGRSPLERGPTPRSTAARAARGAVVDALCGRRPRRDDRLATGAGRAGAGPRGREQPGACGAPAAREPLAVKPCRVESLPRVSSAPPPPRRVRFELRPSADAPRRGGAPGRRRHRLAASADGDRRSALRLLAAVFRGGSADWPGGSAGRIGGGGHRQAHRAMMGVPSTPATGRAPRRTARGAGAVTAGAHERSHHPQRSDASCEEQPFRSERFELAPLPAVFGMQLLHAETRHLES